jgi:hypothetical protein
MACGCSVTNDTDVLVVLVACRILLQEEFVDGSEMVVEEEDEEEEEEEPKVEVVKDPKDKRGDFGNLNKRFKFDPVCAL